MVPLGADGNHDEVLVGGSPGDDEVQAIEAATAALRVALDAMQRVQDR